MEKKTKYQSKLVTVVSGTTANNIDTDLELDAGYTRVTGIAVHEISDGGSTNGYYAVGVKDQNKIYHDITHINNWDGGAGVGPNEKFKKIDMPVTPGMYVSVTTGVKSTLSSDLSYEIVFRLEKDTLRN